MDSLKNKKILFCVCGGAAAYQAPELVASLNAEGAEVTALATPDVSDWVSLRLLERLVVKLVADPAELADNSNGFSSWVLLLSNDLSEPARTWLIAALQHMAEGMAEDDRPAVVCLGSEVAAEQVALSNLSSRIKQTGGVVTLLVGDNQLPRFDPIAVIAAIVRGGTKPALAGKRVLVTAGPTFEDIDPVRFIGNRSSGKMGFAVAVAAWQAGAEVILITGPVSLSAPHGMATTWVRSASDMLLAVEAVIGDQDVYISSAAVADYRPAQVAEAKIKKGEEQFNLQLVANPDLLKQVAGRQSPPFCVGFAAETERVEEYARGKLVSKNLQMIAANQVGAEVGGFESDQNRLHLFWPGGDRWLPWSSKTEQARQLIETIAERFEVWNCQDNVKHEG